MKRRFRLCSLPLCALLALLLAPPVAAQHYLPGARTFVPSPQALGMGGAATAYPSARTALFYNPAHLIRLHVTRAPVTMFGLSASISKNFSEQFNFYNDRLEPALDQGIGNLEQEEAQALFDDVVRLSDSPTVLSADVLLPSFVLNRGRYGFGGGLFAHSEVAYSVEDAGDDVPGMDFTALADFMAVAAGAADLSGLGLKGVSTGVTARYVQRYVSVKLKPFDAIDDDESLYVLGAGTLAFDLGLLYEAGFKGVPGKFYFGAVWSDLAENDFDYRFTAYYVKKEEVQNDEKIAGEVALAQERYQLRSSFRAGVAYLLPTLGGPVKETAFALDYVGYQGAAADQPLLGRLALGVQTKLGKALSLRTGLNQGYTTLGAGLQLSFARIDYAYYGSELGRLPGQAPGWHHRVQLSLGSF